MRSITGIHHVTAICGDPQRNVDFYTGLMGLRLVKQTVNYDDPVTWHLYYGDGLGSPGTLLTFFAWMLPPMVTAPGRRGTGQIAAAAFAISERSLDFWIDRLAHAAVDFDGPTDRLGEPVLSFLDPDGMALELIARRGVAPRAPWGNGPVPASHAVRGLAGVTICLDGYERTARHLVDGLGFRAAGAAGSRFRFAVGAGPDEATVDLHCQPEAEAGRIGIGSVHHVAWRAQTAASQAEWRESLAAAGVNVTPVLDRLYFQSIYFREPGGVQLEIATDGPGFAVDEPVETLGTRLRLPPWLEPRRARIEARLPPLRRPDSESPTVLP